MLLFWVVIAVLTCAATALVAWPLLASSRLSAAPAPASDESRRLAVYRDRRRELEAERDSGRLSADEAARSLDELAADTATQFAPAAAEPAAGANVAGKTRWPLLAAIVAGLVIPAAALILYAQVGSPELVAGVPTGDEPSAKAIQRAIAELKTKVRKNPNDGQAWATLGEANKMQGDLPASVAAYRKAASLLPNNARVLADYAEALAMSAGGNFDGQPTELLEKALAADPTEIKSMVMMGVAQYRKGNLDRALKLLKRAMATVGEDSEDGKQIAHIVARIESEAGVKTAPAASGTPAAAALARAGAPPAATANPGATITGTVTIDDSMRKEVPAGAILFVSARLAQGPRMPLAAVRLAADHWPQRFELTDAQAMDSSRLLSGAKQVVIDAHISRNGNPIRQSGDVFGSSAPVKPGTHDVAIKIDQRVP